MTGPAPHPVLGTRRDAVRNYHRILAAARDVLGESGPEASMEEIAARAGVGVGTVYRHFASKDALIDELLRLALEEILTSAGRALARTDGSGLEEFLRAVGQSFADHARYANLFVQRRTEGATVEPDTSRLGRAHRPCRCGRHGQPRHHPRRRPGARLGDARARPGGGGRRPGDVAPGAWPRFLDIHLAGLRAAGPGRT